METLVTLKVEESLTSAGSTKYLAVGWPEIQEYMDHPDYPEECYFDPKKDTWFIPESWEEEIEYNINI